jgi:hypothetical protein
VSDVLRRIVGFIDDAAVEKGYQKLLSSYGGNTQLIETLELERKGGPCHYCERPYRKVDAKTMTCPRCDGQKYDKGKCGLCNGTGKFENPFAYFSRFEPSCNCYRRCGICGRWLVAERFLSIDHCTSCHPQGVQERKTRKPRKPAFRDGKTAAAGEE